MLMTRVIEWPEGSRLSGMAGVPEGLHPRLWGIVSLHLVDLPDGQQGSAEMSMARAHLPFAGTAIHGTYADGSEWMVLTQVAIVDDAHGFATPEEAAAVLSEQFQRYLRLNPEAFLASEVVLSRLELLTGYQQSGVELVDLADWAMDELLAGMICEMCNVGLTDVVAGREAGCTFPDLDHYCTGNGFTDVFAQWSRGLLASARESAVDTHEPEEGGGHEEVIGVMAIEDTEQDQPVESMEVPAKPLRHVTLEVSRALFGGDFAVSAVWTDDVLHIAHCDYGDGPDTTWGMDIDDPLGLLNWMVRTRFVDNKHELIEYARRQGIGHSDWAPAPDVDDVGAGLTLVAGTDESVVALSHAFNRTEACEIEDGRALTLTLLQDRCQGPDAWDMVTALLERAEISSTPKNRGYF